MLAQCVRALQPEGLLLLVFAAIDADWLAVVLAELWLVV